MKYPAITVKIGKAGAGQDNEQKTRTGKTGQG
jgi:hypothetical protein